MSVEFASRVIARVDGFQGLVAVRLALPFSIAYDTDVDLAMGLLTTAAGTHPRVLQGQYAPLAYLSRFGDSGIELELGIWIEDPEQGRLNVVSDINLAVWKAFRAHGIQIPYPQREVRIVGELATNVTLPGNTPA